VQGATRTWAAGDGVRSPIKLGGLATHQARLVAAAIARLAGAEDVPDFGEPVLQGRLLVGGRTRRLAGRGDAAGAPLWWPSGKLAGEYLPRWLVEHGVVPQAAEAPPQDGVSVERPLHELHGPEADISSTSHAATAAMILRSPVWAAVCARPRRGIRTPRSGRAPAARRR
jgi:hypothetical protein